MLNAYTPNSFKNLVKRTLTDQYLQKWNTSLSVSSKWVNYSIFKETIVLEKYILSLSKSEAITMIKFRTGNHYFPVETGRWENTNISLRNCLLCNDQNEIADEMHYLLKCPFFENDRKRFIRKYYYNRPNTLKLKQLLTSSSLDDRKRCSKFMKILMTTVVR